MQILTWWVRAGTWDSALTNSQVTLTLLVQGPHEGTREITGVDGRDRTQLNS